MKKSLHTLQQTRLVEWLKAQREERGLTMRQLAEMLNKPHSFVGKVEQGERRLDVIEFLQYCEALQVSPFKALRIIDPKLSSTR